MLTACSHPKRQWHERKGGTEGQRTGAEGALKADAVHLFLARRELALEVGVPRRHLGRQLEVLERLAELAKRQLGIRTPVVPLNCCHTTRLTR